MSRILRALAKARRENEMALEPPVQEVSQNTLIPVQKEDLLSKLVVGGSSPFSREEVLIAPPHSFAEDQFRKLKAYILRRSPQPPSSILITSAGPGEGKTTVAVNLAIAFSRESNQKVFLIDADVAKPSIYPAEESHSKGLSDYLEGQSSITEIMAKFDGGNFTLIPAGNRSGEHSDLIGSQRMRDLIRNLRENCNGNGMILIDSAPLLVSSGPLLLSEWVDGAILVVKAGMVPKLAVRKAVESIGREKFVGVVFNDPNLHRSRHYGGYYYGYYGMNAKRP